MTVTNNILLLLCLPAIVFAQTKEVEFKPCEGLNVTKFTVTPCEIEPCKIPRGSSVKIEVDFVANQDSVKVRQYVKAVLDNGIPTGNFPGLKIDACKAKNIECPVTKGEPQHYSTDLKILEFFPLVNAFATFVLTGEDGVLMCVTAEVAVV